MKLNKAHINLLRQNYEQACQAYLEAFCQKHGFTSSYWIADRIGEIADCNESYSVSMSDIITDINEQAPAEAFAEWYEYTLDCLDLNITVPNLRSWLHGCPRASKEDLASLRQQKQDLEQACQSISKVNGGKF